MQVTDARDMVDELTWGTATLLAALLCAAATPLLLSIAVREQLGRRRGDAPDSPQRQDWR